MTGLRKHKYIYLPEIKSFGMAREMPWKAGGATSMPQLLTCVIDINCIIGSDTHFIESPVNRVAKTVTDR